ncbi:MAG TPA: glycosyltransferase family 39 protein [Tepidisphaeraceae bacterium]|jgi:4-amino-4-deoxy-L-arabinose transferase-like glycosyltransferase|nr:glycosyltransferase family 39 protein [Tepidisphaeraceae bacterium]
MHATATNQTHAIPLNAGDSAAPRASVPAPAVSALICFLLSLAMHLPWIGVTPLAGTEAHRVFPARAMVQSHWWLVPTLFGNPFMTKPPLHHWLIAASEIIAGRGNVFVWRLPSALAGAALCAVACWFAARWFGKTPGLISGMCAAGMIAVWGQSQVADIDATNTFFAAVTALCGIESLIVQHDAKPGRRAVWTLAAGLALSGTLLTKGPGALPIILGVWGWSAAFAIRHHHASRILSPPFWAPLLIGGISAGVYAWAAHRSLHAHGLPFDPAGVREGASRLYPHGVGELAKSFYLFLPSLFAYAFPMSLAMPLAFDADVRAQFQDESRRIIFALIAAVLIAWAIYVATGNSNPRYAYPTLILFCPLAGAVATAAVKTRRTADWLRGIAVVSAIALMLATVGLGAKCWNGHSLRAMIVVSAIIAIVVAFWTVRRLSYSWRGAWGLVALFVLTSVPFGMQRHIARTKDSTKYTTSVKLRDVIGDNALVACFAAAYDKPETFYYAHARVFLPLRKADFIPADVPAGTWVILAANRKFDTDEYRTWHAVPGVRLDREMFLCRNEPTDYYLAWYGGISRAKR